MMKLVTIQIKRMITLNVTYLYIQLHVHAYTVICDLKFHYNYEFCVCYYAHNALRSSTGAWLSDSLGLPLFVVEDKKY